MKKCYLVAIIVLLLFILSSLSCIASLPADFNADGSIDFDDLMIFALAYGSTSGSSNWNSACDLDPDGKIDFNDLMLFAMHYAGSIIPARTCRALLVGVGDYMYGDNDLPAPPYDVDRMHDMLSHSGNGFIRINTLTDSQATKSAILTGIASTFIQADSDDVSYFYFSGHGGSLNNISYLMPADFDIYTNTAISVSELESALNAIPGVKVVFLDSCHSGGFIGKDVTLEELSGDAKSFNDEVISTFRNQDLTRDLTGSQYQVLTSSHSSQSSWEVRTSDGYPFGIFTLALCQGCGYDYYSHPYWADENENAEITLKEAYLYTNQMIDEFMNLYNPAIDQDTQVYPDDSQFVIIKE